MKLLARALRLGPFGRLAASRKLGAGQELAEPAGRCWASIRAAGTSPKLSLARPCVFATGRIMRPDDANVAGNVHGGTILKMIEEAGAIISTRHCNSQNGERCVAALARVERTDFLSPMCIGEVAHVSAEITYTSKHSVEVQVNVLSENILTGAKKLTNKATLWYVPLSLKNVDKVLEVPPVVYSRQEQEEEGRKRYEAQKLERMETKWRNGDIVQPVLNPEPNTVSYSQSSLIHLVGPSDCTLHGFVHGGVTMKLMDEVAGIVAARHCKTNIVTASVDAINFHDKIRKEMVVSSTKLPNRDPRSWSSEGDALFQKVLPSAWSSVRGPQCGIVRPRRGPDAGHRFDLVLGGARLLTPRTPLGPSSMAGDIEGPRGSSVQHREMMYGLLTRV
ncbi:cytosolic acyl coenzyme A thioester hydrolase isoform X3 [Cavia porcellus]|uniref:cytosolic acyl coenzyme A thioester hydrolase isoform X3 n=1 Tax=Cavia porcellus TaxID=10141 RepID=UPI002FE14980